MARSNIANGANYFDLVFQLVSDDGVTRVMRAVVYLQSLNVIDSSNSFDVGGSGYGRGGAYAFSGVYNYVPIWYQDIAFTRSIGADYGISVSASISGVNYWGVTLSATEYATIPARYEAPSAPSNLWADLITPTSARINVAASAYAGGAVINGYEAYVLTNNAWPGAGGNVVASAAGGSFMANGLIPATHYFFTARASNTAGYWSAWYPMQVFDTLPSALLNVGGTWKNAIPYVNQAGVWKLAQPYKNVNGIWKL